MSHPINLAEYFRELLLNLGKFLNISQILSFELSAVVVIHLLNLLLSDIQTFVEFTEEMLQIEHFLFFEQLDLCYLLFGLLLNHFVLRIFALNGETDGFEFLFHFKCRGFICEDKIVLRVGHYTFGAEGFAVVATEIFYSLTWMQFTAHILLQH